ncbi:MAG: amidohydrolase [Actinomyces sp.]|nr:MAG: amidohydrolase [Actinomyces sp.]
MIDVHSHVMPRLPRPRRGSGRPALWLRVDDAERGMMMRGDEEYRPVQAALWDPDRRVAELDVLGVDRQVVCVPPLLFAYDLDPAAGAAWAAEVNDRVLELTRGHPDRLLPFCQVPLQDTDAACAEVDRAVAAGHRGVQIGTHVGDRPLSDPAICAFLDHCAATGVPVLVHPWDMTPDPRLEHHMLQWLVGMPAETHLAVLDLALEGAFDRLDPRLRLCFAHGGGAFAFLVGRADNAWHRRDIVRRSSSLPPSAYVDRFYVDSAVFDTRSLRLLVEVMGSDRVLLGSDHPFPLGEERIGELVRSAPLDGVQKREILHEAPRRWLGLDDAGAALAASAAGRGA